MSHYLEFMLVADQQANLPIDMAKVNRLIPYMAEAEDGIPLETVSKVYTNAVIHLARTLYKGTAPTLEDLTLHLLESLANSKGKHFTSADKAHWVNIISTV